MEDTDLSEIKEICEVCHQRKPYNFGKRCKFCSMTLIDEGKDFCSRICKNKFLKLNKKNEKVI